MNIREVMTPNPQCVSPSDSIQDAARIMRDCDTGAVPVVENGRPVGMVTDRDIVVRAVADGGQLSRPVSDIVSGNIVCASPEMSTRGGGPDEQIPEWRLRSWKTIRSSGSSRRDLAVRERRTTHRRYARASQGHQRARLNGRTSEVEVEGEVRNAFEVPHHYDRGTISTA